MYCILGIQILKGGPPLYGFTAGYLWIKIPNRSQDSFRAARQHFEQAIQVCSLNVSKVFKEVAKFAG